MIKKFIALLCVLFGAPAIAHAAPKELYEKSVIVSWSENVESKGAAATVMQNHVSARTLSIYVSGAGRPFVRLMTGFAKSGRRGTTMNPKGGDSANQDPEGGTARQFAVRFEGRQLLVDTKFVSGARRVAINLDNNYSMCNANIIQGREGGAQTMVMTGPGGRRSEIYSIQTVAPSCSIRDGNVFASS